VAALDGRDYVIPDDVKAATHPVLRHRIILRPEADLEGLTPDPVLDDVLRAVEVPK
jgi:MoxR-like ATPase